MTNTGAKIDVSKMPYVGRVVTNIDVGAALPKSGITSFDDVRKKQFNVGASGGGSTTVLFPTALNKHAGAKFKLIRGYSGTINILLAMERGEVDIVGAYGLPGILVSHPGWVRNGEAVILYQASLKRHKLIPNVPTLPELATSDEGREVLHAAAATGDIGRSILTTPGVPPERLAALRTAFQAMLQDPEFIAACEKRKLMIDDEETLYGPQLAWPGTAIFPNLPATAFPAGKDADGLPIGVQAIGPYMEDLTTIRLAELATG